MHISNPVIIALAGASIVQAARIPDGQPSGGVYHSQTAFFDKIGCDSGGAVSPVGSHPGPGDMPMKATYKSVSISGEGTWTAFLATDGTSCTGSPMASSPFKSSNCVNLDDKAGRIKCVRNTSK